MPRGQERLAGHQHARRADPALGASGLEEGHLEQVEVVEHGRLLGARPATPEAFDCPDGMAVDLADRHQARVDDLAVEEDGAGAALAFATALLRPGQAEVLAQDIEQAADAGQIELDDVVVDA